ADGLVEKRRAQSLLDELAAVASVSAAQVENVCAGGKALRDGTGGLARARLAAPVEHLHEGAGTGHVFLADAALGGLGLAVARAGRAAFGDDLVDAREIVEGVERAV